MANTYPYMTGYTSPWASQYQVQPQQQPQLQQQQNVGGIIWVLGEEGAKSFLVAPNNTVPLWDSEKQVIYLKSVDAFGRPSLTVLDYTMRNQQPQQPSPVAQPQASGNFVIRSDSYRSPTCSSFSANKGCVTR